LFRCALLTRTYNTFTVLLRLIVSSRILWRSAMSF
jgi:hypothetical protein